MIDEVDADGPMPQKRFGGRAHFVLPFPMPRSGMIEWPEFLFLMSKNASISDKASCPCQCNRPG